MMIALVLMLAGFVALIKGADLFVDGAARLARGMHISPMAVGLTVVAFGTSAPELFVNISAGISGNTDLALGNVVGSNIANILLILGVTALVPAAHRFQGNRVEGDPLQPVGSADAVGSGQ